MRLRPILFALFFALIPMALSAETVMQCYLRCPPGNNSCTQCCSAHGGPTFDCRNACFRDYDPCDELKKCGPHPRCTPCEMTECESNAHAVCSARRKSKMDACLARCDAINIGNVCGGSASKTHKPEKLAARTP